MQDPFVLRDISIQAGERRTVNLRVARLYDHTEMSIPVHVVHGRQSGPVLFVSAAIHGDEINGVEIIHRLLSQKSLRRLRGTLLAIPIVNIYGFNNRSRYLPDRRDLNRSFPGSKQGSLAAQVAHVFMRDIVERSTHGIDLHTGAIHRTNLPQIRACLDDVETRRLAEAFGTPVILNSATRDGSLRQAAVERGLPILLYEGGEALRFDGNAVRTGLQGVLSVMRYIGMLPAKIRETKVKQREAVIALGSHWIRANRSGIFRALKHPGDLVEGGQPLATISGPLGERERSVTAQETGIIVGQLRMPLVNRGDALFHIATFHDPGVVHDQLEEFDELDELDYLT